jgi:hypothetical protein
MSDCHANWSLIADYLKIFISWPFFGGILLVIFWVIYRKEISKRIKEGIFRTPIGDSYPPQEAKPENPKELKKKEDELSALEEELKRVAELAATKVVEVERSIQERQELINRLKKVFELAEYFRFKYLSLYLIPDTQRILIFLSKQKSPSMLSPLMLILSGVTLSNFNLDPMLSALLETQLIEESPQSLTQMKTYQITKTGRDFVEFLHKEGLPRSLVSTGRLFNSVEDKDAAKKLTEIFNPSQKK